MRPHLFLLLLLVACDDPTTPVAAADAGAAPDSDAAPAPAADAGPQAWLPPFCADYPPADLATATQSTRVFYGADGRLTYVADDDHNRIPDFGFAGYHHGERELPEIAEAMRIGPIDGDDTEHIQAALDALPAGALVLEPGDYQIAGTLRVATSGVVLRGSGQGDDPATATILHATGDTPHQRSVIVLGRGGSGGWREALPDTQVDITSAFVAVGATSFEVDDPTRFAVGDRVIVRHPSTAAWIAALGGGGATVAWTAGSQDIEYLRRVVAIDGATVTLDVPIYNHLDRALGQSVVYAVDDADFVREVGVEQLRIDVETAGGEDENHAWSAVDVAGAEDAWVRDVTALHFGYAGVRVQDSDRVTVRAVSALEPVAQVTGGRLYNFSVDHFAQQVLFVDCVASYSRHAFVSNGTSTVSGVVFLRGRVEHGYTSSEGHRRWSQALLYDGIVEVAPGSGRVVGLYNRGDYGTQHGWAAAHSVLWRYDTGGKSAVVQQPPTAQNWAIGTIGGVDGDGPFAGPVGYIEPIDGELAPRSLYEAQLCDRLESR